MISRIDMGTRTPHPGMNHSEGGPIDMELMGRSTPVPRRRIAPILVLGIRMRQIDRGMIDPRTVMVILPIAAV